VKYNTFDLFIYLFIYTFFFNSSTGHTPQRILTRDGSKDAFLPKEVAFGGWLKKLKLTLNPYLCPQMANFGKKVGEIFGENALQWGRSGVNDPQSSS